jgi:hypothetical protein
MDKVLIEHIMTHGREKSRLGVVDRSGVEFRVGNVVCDSKVYFVVSANGKIVECVEIEIDHPTEKGGAE